MQCGHCFDGESGGVSFFLAWIRDEGFGVDRGVREEGFFGGVDEMKNKCRDAHKGVTSVHPEHVCIEYHKLLCPTVEGMDMPTCIYRVENVYTDLCS